VPLCPPQTPDAARTRTRAAAVGSQRLTAELRHDLNIISLVLNYDCVQFFAKQVKYFSRATGHGGNILIDKFLKKKLH
jgi:hypothetical protein